MNYYGIRGREEIIDLIRMICKELDTKETYQNAFNLVKETLYAESGFGETPDPDKYIGVGGGVGIAQTDYSAWEDVAINTKYKQKIWEAWRIDLDEICHSALIYNEFLSILFCRLYYKRFEEPIPNTMQGRAKYWKKYYNTELGAGTVEHYMRENL